MDARKYACFRGLEEWILPNRQPFRQIGKWDKLETVIGRLKEAGLLVAPQLSIAQGYLSFRNHALHAEWDKIDRTAVGSALALVEELLLKHFS